MSNSYETLWKSVAAGILIAIGGAVNLSVGGIAGAILFSLGLLSILYFELNLYTGKVGYKNNIRPRYRLAQILFGNWVGATLSGICIGFSNEELRLAMKAVSEAKLNISLNDIFIKSLFCGILMFIAVDSFKKLTYSSAAQALLVVLPVSVFILCGFEHCIADMFYFSCYSNYVKLIPYLLVIITGNSIGSNLIRLLLETS